MGNKSRSEARQPAGHSVRIRKQKLHVKPPSPQPERYTQGNDVFKADDESILPSPGHDDEELARSLHTVVDKCCREKVLDRLTWHMVLRELEMILDGS